MNVLIVAGFCLLYGGSWALEFNELELWPKQSVFLSWPLYSDNDTVLIQLQKVGSDNWISYSCVTKDNVCLNKAVLYDLDIATYDVKVTVKTATNGENLVYQETIDVIKEENTETSDRKCPSTGALIAFLCIFLLTTIVLAILVILFWRKSYIAQKQDGSIPPEESRLTSVFSALPFPTKLRHNAGTLTPSPDAKESESSRPFEETTTKDKLGKGYKPPASKTELYNAYKSEQITGTWVPPAKKATRSVASRPSETTKHETRAKSRPLPESKQDPYIRMDASTKRTNTDEEQHEYLDVLSKEDSPVSRGNWDDQDKPLSKPHNKDDQQEVYEITEFGAEQQVQNKDEEVDYICPISGDDQGNGEIMETIYEN